jgi:hypothetical protein
MILSDYRVTEILKGTALYLLKSIDRDVFPETELLIYVTSYVCLHHSWVV